MKRQFIGNLVFLQLLNLLVKPVWIFLIDREVQNMLGDEVYGQYFIHINLALLFIILLDIGIQTFNTKAVSEDGRFFSTHFKSFIGLKLILSLGYMLLLLGIGLGRELNLWWLGMLGLNQVLSGFVLYFRSNLAGLQQYRTDSILSVTDKFISIIICAALLFSGLRSGFTISWFIAAQNIGMGIALIAALVLNLRALGKAEAANLKLQIPNDALQTLPFTKHSTVSLIKQSLPYALLIALMSLYTRIDATMIDMLAVNADFEAGIYAKSFRLLDAATMFAMLFSGLLLPMFSSLLTQKSDLKPLTYLAGKLLFLGSVAVCMGCIFYSEQLMRVLYRFPNLETLVYASRMFGWVIASFIPMCMVYVFGTLLTARGDIRQLNFYALASVIANIVLNLVLIPKYNALGAAIATLCTQGLFSIFCVIRCFRLFSFGISYVFIGRTLAFVVILSGFYVVTKSLPDWAGIPFFALGAALLLPALGFFKLSQLKLLLSNK